MTGVFSYPNSNHADQAPASAPGAAPAATAPTAESKPFSYPETNKAESKGLALAELPEAVRELRAGDDARRLYSPQKTYAEVLPVDRDAPEEVRAAAAEWREIFADWELPVNDARELVGVFAGLKEFPTEGTLSGWENDAVSELRRVYGEDAKRALEDARALVARDPRLKNFLNVTGLGSHPAFVRHAASIARSQRGRGRLK